MWVPSCRVNLKTNPKSICYPSNCLVTTSPESVSCSQLGECWWIVPPAHPAQGSSYLLPSLWQAVSSSVLSPFLFLVIKVCVVFSNRVSASCFCGQPRKVALGCILWGNLWELSVQQLLRGRHTNHWILAQMPVTSGFYSYLPILHLHILLLRFELWLSVSEVVGPDKSFSYIPSLS